MPDPPIPDDGVPGEDDVPQIDPLSGVPLPIPEHAEEYVGKIVDRNIQQAEEDLGLRDAVSETQGATHAAAADSRFENYEKDLPVEVLDQDTSTSKSGAAAFAAATVLVAAVGVGVWAANNGGDDSTGAEAATTTVESESSTTESPDATTAGAAVDPLSGPKLGERWVIYAKRSQGHRDVGTQFDAYLAGLLVFADGQEVSTQHPRYDFESGIVMFTDIDQAGLGTGCTYTGAASLNAVDPSLVFVEGRQGFLEFDLTEDPPTYWSQMTIRGLDWTLTHTCPETQSSQNYGESMVWVDTHRSEEGYLKLDTSDNYVLFDGYVGGSAGYVDGIWIMFPCEPELCDSWLDVLSDDKMAGIIDQTITDAINEGL